MKNRNLKNVIEMGLLCGSTGLIIGSIFSLMSNSEGFFRLFWLRSTLASLITGSIVWYFFVVRSSNYSSDRGGLSGIIISVVSQYLLWYILQFQKFFCFITTGGCLDSFGEATTFLSTIYVSFMTLFLGLLWLGWFTIPLGFFLGVNIAARQKFRMTTEGLATDPRQIEQTKTP